MHREKYKHYHLRAKTFVEMLERDCFGDKINFRAEYFMTEEPVPFSDCQKYDMKPLFPGEQWGSDWQCAWLRLRATIPQEWDGKKLIARLHVGGEALIFNSDGIPLQGLTGGSVFKESFVRDTFRVTDNAKGGDEIELMIDSSSCKVIGLTMDRYPRNDAQKPGGSSVGKITYMELCVFDEDVWQLFVDLELGMSLLSTYNKDDYRYRQLLMIFNDAADIYRGDTANANAARTFLKEKFFSSKANSSALKVTAVGHAHIDTAWLWPIRETIRKCGRTFANQIGLLEKYPEYVFGASQPQHYQFTKEHYPSLYEKIKKMVADGRWELQGGMWIEADCNLISGESMIRQFLHGKNFYMDEFGFEVKNLWLPDVFGYSAAMPQILKGSGCDYFLTQKISWNQFNVFPHHTFVWKGIDGSEVLAHFPPENGYSNQALPTDLCAGQKRFNEADVVDEFLSLYGIGDGGGGARDDYIERMMRMKDLEGCPKVKMGRADEFFERLNRFRDKLDIWEGELFLELHQGTLTTQAKVKRMNRKLEYLLKHIEFVYSCLDIAEYPSEELDALWKILLLNQFHDIIPGSSITRVYKETNAQYEEILERGSRLLQIAANSLMKPDPKSVTLFNPLGCDYHGPVKLPDGWSAAGFDGTELPAQNESGTVYVEAKIPAYGFITLTKSSSPATEADINDNLILENELIRYEFNADGQIISAYDKEAGYEVITEDAPANVISIYHDNPPTNDAWDIDITYEKQLIENAKGRKAVKSSGKVRQTIDFELNISNSSIKQKAVLGSGKRLDFITQIDWNENHRMLRTKFPTEIHTTEATYDIQYGYIKRNAHTNTSWDMARFEVPAHRYADISDAQYGIAVLNDSKYGHKVSDKTIDLTLMRSTKYPDFVADIGGHEFTYSLLPHTGSLVNSDVMNNAAVLNQPPLSFPGYDATGLAMPCAVDSADIVMEACKKAEKENCLIIRLVETKGWRSKGKVILNRNAARVVKTNIIEWENGEDFTLENDSFDINLQPFEIATLKVYLL